MRSNGITRPWAGVVNPTGWRSGILSNRPEAAWQRSAWFRLAGIRLFGVRGAKL